MLRHGRIRRFLFFCVYSILIRTPHNITPTMPRRCRCWELTKLALYIGSYECGVWCGAMYEVGAQTLDTCARTVQAWCDEVSAEMTQQRTPASHQRYRPPPASTTFPNVRYELAGYDDAHPTYATHSISHTLGSGRSSACTALPSPPPLPPLPASPPSWTDTSADHSTSSDTSSLCVHHHELDDVHGGVDDVEIEVCDPWSIV